MAKEKLGSGVRFENLKNKFMDQGYSEESAKAIDAAIGRKKYGNKRMNSLALKGRKK